MCAMPKYSFHDLRSRPELSPRFPYTTLFRSTLDLPDGVEARQVDQFALPLGKLRSQDQCPVIEVFPKGAQTDRKSTRLNSSHLGISYAVFCLKKKKHSHPRRHTSTHHHYSQC